MKKASTNTFLALLLFLSPITGLFAQQSVARQWNEELLDAIRNDFARPTVHARNLFHTSVAIYDAWAVYDDQAQPFLLGKRVAGYQCFFDGIPQPADLSSAREEAISYAAFRLLNHRFAFSPNFQESLASFEDLMVQLDYDPTFTTTDYSTGIPAALGNYIAGCLISFGLQDGSNEILGYENQAYEPVNEPLLPEFPGNPTISNPNRWQPLTLEVFIDQSGNPIPGETPGFLGPEWGQVVPFALSETDLNIFNRDDYDYWVYHDPGAPPSLDYETFDPFLPDEYIWGFSLVAIWSSQLDPADGVLWDISPNSIGNIPSLPQNFEDYRSFYNLLEGGDPSQGRTVNPVTGLPYEIQMVPRADYARVLAEFWADGPESETPPGHWFTILNYVNDHPLFEKRFSGQGDILDGLEWDVKAYFTMGGAMHDAAITAWGIKGYYDYVRPVSAIRYMCDRGQSTDNNLGNYDPHGIPLMEGFIEMVEIGDPLAGENDVNVGKIKFYSWKGPDYIIDPLNDVAGVDWILAENWWPYQRPTFITPPFAGYISGHSTFSRAAAEVMTLLTGDEYFPGGLGEFFAPQNEFLVFEDGPSVDVILQWATYKDASEQTSLSRIWGGIHPPADDIPGRIIGEEIGIKTFQRATEYFEGLVTGLPDISLTFEDYKVYPNPVNAGSDFQIEMRSSQNVEKVQLINVLGQIMLEHHMKDPSQGLLINTSGIRPGIYTVKVNGKNWTSGTRLVIR